MRSASAAIGFLAAALLHAQPTPVSCSVATLSGTRSLVLTGREVPAGSSMLQGTFLGNGTATFDGNGGVTFNLTVSQGAPSAAQTWSGTYALPANCLGTLNITTGDTASFTLIPYDSGKDFTLTGADAIYDFTGSGATQPTACVAASLSGAYAFTGNGYSYNIGASPASGIVEVVVGVNAISGSMTFDGVSAVTVNASWTVSNSTTQTTDTLGGTYSMAKSGCTATANLTDSAGINYVLNFTVSSDDASTFDVIIAPSAALTSTVAFTATGHSTFTNPGLSVELAAGSGLPIPPGNLFSIYGTDLANGQGQLTGFPLPTTIQQASVTVNGESVPLYYVDAGLINAQMPLDIQPGVATLVVKNGSNLSNAAAINISDGAAPGVFLNGGNHAAAQNLPDYTTNTTSNPAAAGSTIVVYFTGGGPVQGQSSLVTGHQTPAAQFPITLPYAVTVAGVQATVDYIGLVPTEVGGFYQANIVVPNIAAGDHDLVITIGGKASNTTTVSTK